MSPLVHMLMPASRRWIAVAIVGLLAFSSVTVGVVSAATAATGNEKVAITSGSLTWGFKESFRNYTGRLQGAIASGGVTLDSKAIATFSLASGTFDPATNSTDLAFGGGLQFRSHCEAGLGLPAGACALDMTFTKMHLVISQDEQTLYAHIVGRRLVPGHPMTDFGTIAVANLTISGANVITDSGATTWSGIAETSTVAAVDPTTYPAGTPFDVFGFTYSGPGGKPDIGDAWTPPGTATLAKTHTSTGAVAQTGPRALYVDDQSSSVHVMNKGTSFDLDMPLFSAYAYDGLASRGTSSGIKAAGPDGAENSATPFGFDSDSGRVFLLESSGVSTLTWDAGAASYVHATIDPAPGLILAGGITWDAALNRVFAITVDEGYQNVFLSEWAPHSGTWLRRDMPLPRPEDTYEYVSYFTPSSAANGPAFAALSDGTLILTREFLMDPQYNLLDTNPAPLHLSVSGNDVAATVVAGAITASGPNIASAEASWVVAGPNDQFLLGPASSSFIRMGQGAPGGVTVATKSVAIPMPANQALVAAFDPTDGTVWAKGVISGIIAGVRDGKVFSSEVFADTAQSYTIAVGADHKIYTGGRTQETFARVAEISRLGISPTVQTQPRSVTVGDGVPATFSTVAVGAPSPTVQWQQQLPGEAKFSDIPGATSSSLSVSATAQKNSAQYRAVYTNAAGALATDAVVLTVNTSPRITVQPLPQKVKAGDSTSFQVMSVGNPEPQVTWQRLSGQSWINLTEADGFVLGQGTITVPNATAALNGLQLRARVSNSVATIYSSVAALTVSGGDGVAGAKPSVAGFLSWGVKGSFRSYITGPIASGWVAVSNGASAAGGAYVFPQGDGATWRADTSAGTAPYRGAVQFYGHAGVLNVTLSNPQVTIDSASHATLSFSVNGSGPVSLGSVDLSRATRKDLDGGITYLNAPVTLTGAGVGAFSYGSSQFYSAGQAMDPLSFTVGAAAGATGGGKVTVSSFTKDWVPPASPPSTTGINLTSGDADNLVAGGTVTIEAGGFTANEDGIKLVIYSSPRVLANNLIADSKGMVSWTGALPSDLTGEHTLTLQGSVNRGIVLTIKAATTVGQCTVDGAELSWGFKESFRAYISSAIANGKWTVAGGASYATPNFGWSTGMGSLNPTTGAALVKFAGTMNFTGHGGVLNTTVGNPQIQLVDKSTGLVLLDVSGPTMDGTPTDIHAASFAQLDLSKGQVTYNKDGSITAKDVPAVLTADGNVAFPNYPAGTAMDPVSFTLPVATGCGDSVPVARDKAHSGKTALNAVHTSAEFQQWWVGGGVLAVLVIAAVVLLLMRRRRVAQRRGESE